MVVIKDENIDFHEYVYIYGQLDFIDISENADENFGKKYLWKKINQNFKK